MERIKFYLVLIANPLTNSISSKIVFNAITRLDILSRDVTIFMPGFYSEKDLQKCENNKNITDSLADYHGKTPAFVIYCDSMGSMYFSDALFARFMNDLSDEFPNFDYYGRTELLVMPTSKGKIMSKYVQAYNLELLIKSTIENHIEEFLLKVLRTIQRDKVGELECLEKINYIYKDFLPTEQEAKAHNRVVVRLDNEIMQYMQWSENDEIWFISYSTKDEFDAFALKGLLENKGKHVWIAPDGIPSDRDYALAIPAALRITSRFLVLLSKHSAESDWVRREIDRAINEKKKIDGVLLTDFSMNDVKQYDHLSFLLANIQIKYNISDLFKPNSEPLERLLCS